MQAVSQLEPRVIPASDTGTQFQGILRDVESGQTVLVVRDGAIVARIEPVHETAEERHARFERAYQEIMEIRKHTKPMTIEETLSARDEGRR